MRQEYKNSNKKSYFLIPRFADIFFAILFIAITFNFGQRLLADGDTGYHIRVGEYIIKTFSIPRHDIFSFISPSLPWTAHEWLSEVIMAVVHNWFGLSGVTTFFAGLIALVYYLIFRMLRRINGGILIPLLLVMFAAISSMLHWLARPHIFTLLLITIWYDWLDRYQHEDNGPLYLMPPLMLIWANLHGGFVTGFILLGIYGTGNLILSRFGEKTGREEARRRGLLILKITMFCIIFALFNPFGYHLLLFPLRVVADSQLMDSVQEFLSPNFHRMEILPFRILLLSIIVLLAASRRKANIIEIGLLIFFINMALYSARYITLFAIITVPIAARLSGQLPKNVGKNLIAWLCHKESGIAAIDNQARGCLWPIASILAVLLLLVQTGKVITFSETTQPVAAVEFLKRERIPGNMFNNDEFGDYIIYAAWPQYHVFFDGRSDMYGIDRIREYYKVINLEDDWELVMKKYNMSWIIFNADSALSRHLRQRDDWRLIYADKVANIFVRNIPLYYPLIRKYPMPTLFLNRPNQG